MTGTGKPRSLTEFDIADLRQPETTPLALRRQARLAPAAKLIGQRFLLPLRVAEDDRAKLARIAAVHADDLLMRTHCLLERGVISAWHGSYFGRLRSRKHPCHGWIATSMGSISLLRSLTSFPAMPKAKHDDFLVLDRIRVAQHIRRTTEWHNQFASVGQP
jgi:hypothetical protein